MCVCVCGERLGRGVGIEWGLGNHGERCEGRHAQSVLTDELGRVNLHLSLLQAVAREVHVRDEGQRALSLSTVAGDGAVSSFAIAALIRDLGQLLRRVLSDCENNILCGVLLHVVACPVASIVEAHLLGPLRGHRLGKRNAFLHQCAPLRDLMRGVKSPAPA